MPGLLHRRRELLKERQILKDQRAVYTYGQMYNPLTGWGPAPMPAQLEANTVLIDTELRLIEHELLQVFLELANKLPRCSCCEELAFFQIKNGPFFWELHAGEHPTAQRVEWGSPLSKLFIG